MTKYRKSEKKAYTSPGSLIYVGKEVNQTSRQQWFRYNENGIEHIPIRSAEEFYIPPGNDGMIDWVNVEGLHDIPALQTYGKTLGLHPLLLEDILNTEQKPKLEHYGNNHLFLVMKMLRYNSENKRIESDHLALVLGEEYVVSFQELDSVNVWQPIVDRLNASIGKTRKNNADYLFYSLCDVVVDSYFVLLEDMSEVIEQLEMQVIENPQAQDQTAIYALRREMLAMRKAIMPLREIFSSLIRDDSPLIRESNELYFRDIYDHVLQVLDLLDIYREMIENLQNVYINSQSQRMNAVMKTLTVFTAIFMPLTFIVGIYGMNFENMPELKEPNGYFYTLGGMALLGIGLWFYFKWKKYM